MKMRSAPPINPSFFPLPFFIAILFLAGAGQAIGIKLPTLIHDAADPQSDPIPMTMKKYRSGGTPWTVIIDQTGHVVYNQFHIGVDQAATLINDLL